MSRGRQCAYLWQASRGQRGRILLSCLTGVGGVLLSLAFIYTSKVVIDVATGHRPGHLWNAAALAIVLLLLQLGCSALDSWLSARMQVEAGNALRSRLFDRLIRSRWSELERFHTGDVVNRIEQDTTALVTLLTGSLPEFIVAGVQFAAAFTFFILLDSALPWVVVAILPLCLLGARFYMRRMRRYTRLVRQSDSRIQELIQESLQHHAVLKSMQQEHERLERLQGEQETLRRQVMRRTRFSVSARTAAGAAFAGGYLTAFLWGAAGLAAGTITFGTMTAFLQLVGQIQQPAFNLSRLLPALINALTAVERLHELETLPAEAGGEAPCFAATPDVELSDVSFAYDRGDRPVLSHFTHRFAAGTRTAVLGETGAGKTTLVRLLLALVLPTEGSCTLSLRGQSVPISPQTRANFVYVPQGNTLLSGTIRQNLLLGNARATDSELRAALHTACADFVDRLDEGLDTLLGEQGGGLSEGQAQRIAIARALLRPGHILVLDEATSALDAPTEQQLIERLSTHYADKTMILITHHAALADVCDAVVRL
jgi:ABC-type multidrug transport system fused ATPase/permease subunit